MDLQTRVYKSLIWLTLYASALHFFDNVMFWDEYAEPTWLTKELSGSLWLPLVLLAHRAVDSIYTNNLARSYRFTHEFVMANLVSLGHYLYATPADTLARINFMIFLQVGLAVLLLLFALWMQLSRMPETMRKTGSQWLRMSATVGMLIALLEVLWPAKQAYWWL
jgi:hypothetical protein